MRERSFNGFLIDFLWNTVTSSVFELEQCFITYKWGRIGPGMHCCPNTPLFWLVVGITTQWAHCKLQIFPHQKVQNLLIFNHIHSPDSLEEHIPLITVDHFTKCGVDFNFFSFFQCKFVHFWLEHRQVNLTSYVMVGLKVVFRGGNILRVKKLRII